MGAAIQAAMDYSYNDGKQGGKVYFRSVVYAKSVELTHRRGVYLIGASWFFNMDYTATAK